MFGIIRTTIENVEYKIGKLEVKIQHLITINQLPVTNNQAENRKFSPASNRPLPQFGAGHTKRQFLSIKAEFLNILYQKCQLLNILGHK